MTPLRVKRFLPASILFLLALAEQSLGSMISRDPAPIFSVSCWLNGLIGVLQKGMCPCRRYSLGRSS